MAIQIRAGDVSENPVTGERAIVLEAPPENPERRLVVEMHARPGAAVVGEHLHPAIRERFEVLSGRLGVKLDGKRSAIGPGEAVDVPAGRWHDWWQEGPDKAVVRIEITPGDRFIEMIRTIFGLALDGKTNTKGMPRPLQLVAIGREFDDVLIFRQPPRAVQRAVFGALAPLARARGYRGSYPRYTQAVVHGTPEDVRSGAELRTEFGPGPGPPR